MENRESAQLFSEVGLSDVLVGVCETHNFAFTRRFLAGDAKQTLNNWLFLTAGCIAAHLNEVTFLRAGLLPKSNLIEDIKSAFFGLEVCLITATV
jgi:hypothetical protein